MDLTTDPLGAFEVPSPQLALYHFSNALPGSACKDAITGATVRFPMTLYVPPVTSTVINPISLLTVPAADDASVTRLYNGRLSDGRAPHYLWTHVYKLFGYDANQMGVSDVGEVLDALTRPFRLLDVCTTLLLRVQNIGMPRSLLVVYILQPAGHACFPTISMCCPMPHNHCLSVPPDKPRALPTPLRLPHVPSPG